jgi:hypothetical protein
MKKMKTTTDTLGKEGLQQGACVYGGGGVQEGIKKGEGAAWVKLPGTQGEVAWERSSRLKWQRLPGNPAQWRLWLAATINNVII